MNVFKKVSLSSLMFVMVFGMSFGNFVPKASAALMTGDLVKGPNSDAVYYINGSMKHVFPDKKTFMTWYSNFDGVKTVAVSELDMYATGAPVAYRPGTNLITHPNTARVYAVEPGGVLRWVPDEATALALYGSNWAKWVRDVHELTFGNYTVGSDLTSAAPSKGTVLQKTGDSTIYYFDGTNIRPFGSSAAFDANNLNYDYVVKVSSLGTWTVGSSITGAETFATISGVGTGTVTGPAGTLTVALSPNTAAANQVLITGASRVPMVTVRLTAGNTAVVVDSLVIERKGIASDAAFSSFDLLDGSTMLPLNDSSKTLNSNHQATFNDDFTIPANTSWDVVVAANMCATTSPSNCLGSYAGEYPAIAVASMALKNNSTLSGTLPVTGNVMLTNGTLAVGTATVANGANNPSAATKQVGQKDYVVTSVKVTNNSSATGQNMTLKSVTFTNNGSASNTDVQNLRLVNSNTGATLATLANPTSDKVSFTNLNLQILKGNNVNLDLKLDIAGGSGRTIDYDIEKQGDIVVFDELRGFNVSPTPFTSEPLFNAAVATVDNGRLRVESVAVTPQNTQENKTGVLLGKFKFVVEGEPINVTRMPIKFILGTSTAGGAISGITNVTLKNPAGTSVMSGQDPTSNGWIANSGSDQVGTATSTDSIALPIGETIYSVYADLSNIFNSNDTIQTQINPLMITGKGDVTGDSLDVETTLTAATDITPTVDVSGTTMTIKSVDLNVSVSSSPAAQTVVAGTPDVEVANIVLDAGTSGSDVRVINFKVPIVTTGNVFPDMLTGIELYVGSTKVPVDSSTTAYSTAGSTAGGSGTTTLTITSGNLTIPAGQSKTVRVVGDIGTGATSGTFKVGMQNDGIVANDSENQSFTVDFTVGQGQAMTLSSGGTLNVAVAQDPKANMVVAGQTVKIGQFTAQAKNEPITINSFGFLMGNPDGGVNITDDYAVIESLEVKEGSTSLGTIPLSSANATVTPSTPISIALNAEKTYEVYAKFRSVTSPSSSQSGAGVTVTLTNVDADGQAAGSSNVTVSGLNTAFKTFSAFKTTPTVAMVSFNGDNVIVNGSTVDLYRFSVSANTAGPIGLNKFSFGVATSNATLSPTGYMLYESDSSGSGGNILSNTTDIRVITNSNGTVVVETRFDVNNDSSVSYNALDGGEHFIINAGQTKFFTFRGAITAVSTTNPNDDTISTVLAGDAAFAGTSQLNVAGVDGTDTGNDDFIWSDLNFDLYTTSSATETVGWFNGYRVTGLESTSSTPQAVTD